MESRLYDVDALMVFTRTEGFTYAGLRGSIGAREYFCMSEGDFLITAQHKPYFVSSTCLFHHSYFKWSDDTTQSSTQNHEGMPLSLPIVQELQNVFSGGELESAFCGFISAHYRSQGDSAANESQTNPINPFPSLTTEEDRLRDKADGVSLVFEKFGLAPPGVAREEEFLDVADGTTELLLCESMDLFSHIAPKRKSNDALVW